MDVEKEHPSVSLKPDMDADGQKDTLNCAWMKTCKVTCLMQRERAPQHYKVLVLKVMIFSSCIRIERSNGAPDMMHVGENKIVIDSVDGASSDIGLSRLPKRIHKLWITRMYWKPEI